jgi:tetratricopeptide (TPR) repeat protein
MTGVEISEPLGGVILGMLPDRIQQSLRRCAVPQTFSADAYATLLRADGGPDLTDLVETGRVEALSQRSGRYAISPMFRAPALARWWAEDRRPAVLQQPVPAELAALAKQLADLALLEERPVEWLDLAVLAGEVDPPAPRIRPRSVQQGNEATSVTAAEVFRELYDAADEAHDLRLCRALIDVLDAPERRSVLDAELGRLRNEAALRLSSRSMWTTAFYESARYVQRSELEDPLEELLAGRSSRVMQFYADGGMGKTMQVRWLIARRCARRDRRIVCVRVDFDVVHPLNAARMPWLLLVEIAAQLDQQLVGAPFQEFLASFGSYRALLTRVAPISGALIAAPTPASGDPAAVQRRFFDVLRELPADQLMLIVFDTTEEAVGPAIDTTGIIELTADLLAATLACRVLLSGRWDLVARVPRIAKILPELISLPVPLLSEAEQRRYLTEVRGISAPDIVSEIIRLSEGRPLTVGSYAGLVTQSEHVTADVLASFKTPGLVFALERVVERIDSDPLQWLIRYGVVPRQLSFDFVTTVLPDLLRAGLAGSALDDPRQDDRPLDRPREIFRTGIAAPLDAAELRALWDQLLVYAVDYSWVSVQSDDRQLVAFHSEVLNALRDLLRAQPIHRELQTRAAEFYRRLSVTRPELRREAVYHCFQLDHETGAAEWREAVAEARSAGRDEQALDLATDLLGGDYVDWRGVPRRGFSYQLMAEAQLERARAAATLTSRDRGSADPRWSDVEEGFRMASTLAERDDVELPPMTLRILEARLLTAHGRAAEVTPLLADRPRDMPGAERADAEQALGLSLVDHDRRAAGEHFRTAYVLARDAGNRQGAREAALLLAETENRRACHDDALTALDQATDDGVLDRDDEHAAYVRAWSLLSSGRATASEEALRGLPAAGFRRRPWAFVGMALARYQAGDYQAAITWCDAALPELDATGDAPAYGTDQVVAVRGLARAALHAVPDGTDDLLAAAAWSRDLRNFDAATEYYVAAADALLYTVGDLREAQQCLEEARHLDPETNTAGWLYGERVGVRLTHQLGRQGKATIRATETLAVLDAVDTSPRQLVEALIAAIGVADTGKLAGLIDRLDETLPLITPPSARLEALHEIRHVRSLPAAVQPGLDRLVGLAQRALVDATLPASPDDERLQWAALAEVLRVAGRRHAAVEALDRAWSGVSDPLAWWNWLVAMDRLGAVMVPESVPPDDAVDQLQSEFPLLVAAYRILLADRRLEVDGIGRTRERLGPVGELLAATGRQTRWNARGDVVRARLAARAGDAAEAQHRASEAVRIFSKLGDRVARDEVALEFELGEHDWHDDIGTLEMAIYVVDDEVQVFSGQAYQSAPAITLPRSELHLDAAAEAWRAAWSGKASARQWWEWADHVGRRLLPRSMGDDLAGAGPDGLDIRIVPRAADVAALPWELLRLDEATERPLIQAEGVSTLYRSLPRAPREEAKIRSLQIGLSRLGYFTAVPDGYLGARTREALASFQRDVGLTLTTNADHATWIALTEALNQNRSGRPLRVLILRPSAANELQLQRDAAGSGGDVASAYRRHYAKVDVIEDPTLDRVWRYSRRQARRGVDIVHICGTPRMARGSTVIDFGGQVSTRGSFWTTGTEELSVTAMGEVLSALTPDIFSPSVILDVPVSLTASETYRALLARNMFAYQLLRLGRVPAVLATGLAGPDQQDELTELIVDGLTARGSFAATARQIWRCEPARSGDLRPSLPFLTSALFLQRPPATMLPLILT